MKAVVLFCISFALFGTPPAPSRDRSVKPASGRDTWQADALGKIGSANTEKNHDESRGSFFVLLLGSGRLRHPIVTAYTLYPL